VRSYKLIPISEECSEEYSTALYEKKCNVDAKLDQGTLSLEYDYQLNEDCILSISLIDKKGQVQETNDISLLKGYGFNIKALKFSKRKMKKAKSVKVTVFSTATNNVQFTFSQNL
jgi:hypothetical protein